MRLLAWRNLWFAGGIVLVLSVIALTLWPSDTGLVPQALTDKTGHVIAYFVLTLWFSGVLRRPHHWWMAAAFVCLGVGLEGVQAFIATRVSEGLDMVANAAGASLGLLAARAGLDRWCQWIEHVLGLEPA